MNIFVKDIRERSGPTDGVRIMVDGAIPDGIDEYGARLDFWPRGIAPSGRTMRILLDDPGDWDGFKRAYFDELDQHDLWVGIILDRAREDNVTLVYGFGEPGRNNAAALREYLLEVSEKRRAAA